MTPAEHYEKAEACIAEVMAGIEQMRVEAGGQWDFDVPLRLAQVHATLATFKPVPKYVVSNDILRFNPGPGVITKDEG